MAQSKATKKFERNHLKDVLKRRKEHAKVKQRHQIQAKKKQKRAQDRAEELENLNGDLKREVPKDKNPLQEMTVDDFFANGIDLPAESSKTKGTKRKRTDVDDSETKRVSVADSSSEEDTGDELEAHKKDLKALSETDPEFYKYLQENDAELLDLESADLQEVDELSDGEAEASSTNASGRTIDVDKSLVRRWRVSLTEKQSLRQMREVVLAFRAAAHLNEESDKTYKYTVSNADAYHDLLTLALKHVPSTLRHHIPIKDLDGGKIKISTDSKKFKTLTVLLKSHAASIQHLLDSLSDAATTRLTLNSLLELLPYLLSFKKLVRDITRTVVGIWAEPSQAETTRVTGFLVLRRLVVIGDPGIKETVLKTAYQGLVRATRATTIHNVQGHNLMKNSAAELWLLADSSVAYTTAFTFIRQLAIHLRNSIKNNANEAYKAIYNWQYVHSLDFWSRVLSESCNITREATQGRESPLRPLIYPLTQVTLGAMRLIPTAAYFPLRFHTIRALIRVSKSSNTFIPLAAPLYEVLTSTEMRKAPKPSTLKALDFETTIRASKSFLHTRVYQDGLGEQLVELFSEAFILWSKSIAFPELALPVIHMLKRWLKEVSPRGANHSRGKKPDKGLGGNRNTKLNGSISLLIQKFETNSKWIEERRAKIDFAPNSRAGVDNFLKEIDWTKTPLGAFVESQRKIRKEKRDLIEAGRKEEEKKRSQERRERADEMVMEMEHGGVVEKEVDSDHDDDSEGDESSENSVDEFETEIDEDMMDDEFEDEAEEEVEE